MSNDFTIDLSAEDKGAAAALKKLSSDILKAAKSLDVMGSGAEEVGKTKNSVAKVAKPINDIEKAAAGAGFAVSKLQAFIGVAVGGVSLAGVVEMSRQWAEFGAEIRRTSDALGITATSLQALRGGAVMGGLSAESMTGALGSLGKNLQDAKWGRNKGLLSTMSLLNIQFKQTKSGAIDTVAMLDDMVDAFARFQDNPVLQRELFEQAGIGGIFSIANHGSAQMHEKEAEGQHYDPALSNAAIARAEKEAMAFRDVAAAASGLKNVFMDQLAPQMTYIAKFWADWLAKTRGDAPGIIDAAKKTVGEMMMHPGHAVGNAAHYWAAKAWNALPEWATDKYSIDTHGGSPAVWHINREHQRANPNDLPYKDEDTDPEATPRDTFAAPTNSLGGKSGKTWESNKDSIKSKLIGMGYTEAQTYGIMANLREESQGDVNALGDSGQAYGVAQWHPDRQQDFARVMGHDIHGSTLDEQLEFMDWELKNTRKKAGDDLSYAVTPGNSASIFSQEFEAPKDDFGMVARGRARAAEQMAGSVHVQVNFVNAPPGTRAIAQASGNVTTETKIGYTGPGNLP